MLIQLFKPPKLPFVIEEVCGMIFIEDDRPQNETMVKMVIYSTDTSVDLTKSLPKPLKKIREASLKIIHQRVVQQGKRWWYSGQLDDGLCSTPSLLLSIVLRPSLHFSVCLFACVNDEQNCMFLMNPCLSVLPGTLVMVS